MPAMITEFDSLRLGGFAEVTGYLKVTGDTTFLGKLVLSSQTVEQIASVLEAPNAESSLPTSRAVLDYVEPVLQALRAALDTRAGKHGAPDTLFQTGDLEVGGKLTLRGVEVAGIATSLEGAPEAALPSVGAVKQGLELLSKSVEEFDGKLTALPLVKPEDVSALQSRLDSLEEAVKHVKAQLGNFEDQIEEAQLPDTPNPIPEGQFIAKVVCPNCGKLIPVNVPRPPIVNLKGWKAEIEAAILITACRKCHHPVKMQRVGDLEYIMKTE